MLEVNSISVRYSIIPVLHEVSFRVQEGQMVAIVGANGAGKSTILKTLSGLLHPFEGSIVFMGEEIQNLSPFTITARGISHVPEGRKIFGKLTVLENLRFYGRVYGLRNQDLIDGIEKATKMAGLEGKEGDRTFDLSGGWRQRLALAAAIMHEPELLVLDEPTAGVDPVSRRAFWDLLYELVEDGATVFVTTHYMEEADHCQRLAFIQKGKIIAEGTPRQIKEDVMKGKVLELSPDYPDGAMAILREARDEGRLPLGDITLYGNTLHIVVKGVKESYSDIYLELGKAGIHPGKTSVIEPSLEDVFVSSMR